MIVTIDGPAGTGKSTVARHLAERLGFEYLDTGAMYRMVAVRVVRDGVDPTDAAEVAALASRLHLDFDQGKSLLNGEDISSELRTPEVTRVASMVAQIPGVRDGLVLRQREIADRRRIVCEGRDQGTVVFPHAKFKFFLTATPEVRLAGRQAEIQEQGTAVDFETLLQEQKERDRRDEERAVAPLRPAPDADIVDTTCLDLNEVVDRLLGTIRSRQTG